MTRRSGTWRDDPDKFIEMAADATERAIRQAYADSLRKTTAFRKKWGGEGIALEPFYGNCYFYYKPRTDTLTFFCTCEPSKHEPDIIVTAIWEHADW